MSEEDDALKKIVGAYNEEEMQKMSDGLQVFARLMFTYFESLKNAGFSDEQALAMTIRFQTNYVNALFVNGRRK